MADGGRHSEDTVIPDNESVYTALSEDTLADLTSQVFGLPLAAYSTIHDYAVVSAFLHPGVLVFRLADDARHGAPPMLCTQSSVFSVFKKSAPFMIINAYPAGQPREYCRVHFRNVAVNVSCYVLLFAEFQVVVVNNGLRPAADIAYCNTKLRVVGSSGANSPFASGLLKMYILQPSALTLSDGCMVAQNAPGSAKSTKVDFDATANELCDALSRLKKLLHGQLVSDARTVASIPIASYADKGDQRISGLKHVLNGTIRVFEPARGGEEHTMVMLCVMLVLREQEMRKSKGGKRPSYVERE